MRLSESNLTPLCSIMNKHGSDKGIGRHNYTVEYYKLFNERRLDVKSVFEIGIGTTDTRLASNMGADGHPGASLRGWKEFFPNAAIHGADIDTRILINEERIETHYVDQRDESSILTMWNLEPLKDLSFDIIIDDGLHELGANLKFLRGSYHKLTHDGVYIIEDINTNYKVVSNYVRELEMLRSHVNFRCEIINLPHPTNNQDNCLIKLTHFEPYA